MANDLEFYREILLDLVIENIIMLVCFLIIPLLLLLLSVIVRPLRKKAKWFIALVFCIVFLGSLEIIPLWLDWNHSSITVLENATYHVVEQDMGLRPSFGTAIMGGNTRAYIIVNTDGDSTKRKIFAPNIYDLANARIDDQPVTVVYANHSNRLLTIDP